ncbi:MAG: cytochrome c1 [Hyphomonadaceae bacterium]|jgi:cytochrome c1|nr:cytochrome c1 [Hyphomonadaceae bacterium]
MTTPNRAKIGAASLLLASALAAGSAAWAAGGEPVHIDRQKWSFSGYLGKFDEAQLQRGFKVYVETCARCHGLKRIAFRNLVQPGGPSFPEAAVKSLAGTYKVDAEPNDQGKILKRPAILVDYLPSPYKNEQEARAALNGALPPDLSLIAKARGIESHAPFYLVPKNMLVDIATGYQEGGPDYIYAYLTGFKEPPAGTKVPDGMNYNRAFASPHMTAMPNPFAGGDGFVKYDDATPATVDNYARDVTAFLAWTADPRLEERKRLGLLVTIYLLITAVLLYLAKRRIWAKAH